jgi:plastocyanin
VKRWLILSGAALAVVLSAAAFAQPNARALPAQRLTADPPAASASPSAAPAPADSATAAGAIVEIKDFVFAPAMITIAAGEQVTFKNDDRFPHTVTAADKSFDSGSIARDATFSHVFDAAGTYKYSCAYHAFMHGTVVVR